MGVRERKVEQYLNKKANAAGGITRKWVGTAGVPDRIVIIGGVVTFVEVKTVDGRLSEAQKREHTRLKACGANVATVYGKSGVDELI
jgi:Holliday junction resolvase-like predicted endonuclease